MVCFFFQAEDGIRDLVRSRGLGDVYKRQGAASTTMAMAARQYLQMASGMAPRRSTTGLANTSDLSLIHI